MRRSLLLASMFALALSPACFFEPSLSPRDAADDDDGGLGDDGGVIDDNVIATIAVGSAHTCRVQSDTSLECWGRSINGQLGVASAAATGTPQAAFPNLPNLTTGWTTVAAGTNFTCGINTSQGAQVYCWGSNQLGAVNPVSPGSGTPFGEATPVTFTGSFVPERVFAGGDTACALSMTGELRCWGKLDFGGFAGASVTPIAPGIAITSVALAPSHACILGIDGVARCWGDNSHLALGTGTAALVRSAAQLAPIDNTTHFISLAAANNVTCGITTTNTLACWGAGEAAHLGVANGDNSTFTEVDTTHTWRRVAVGSDHVCAIATGTDAGTYCYGNTESGAIASGRFAGRVTRDTPVEGIGPTAQLASGVEFACSLDTAGIMACWGANGDGQLGNNETAQRSSTNSVVSLPAGQVQQLTAGDRHTCAIVDTGSGKQTFCWGDNRHRAVSRANTADAISSPIETVPTAAVPAIRFTQVTAGAWHTCALDTSGDIRCWGDNESNQAPLLKPREGASLAWRGVFAGGLMTCGIADDNDLYCWGQLVVEGTTATADASKHYVINARTVVEAAIGSDSMIAVGLDTGNNTFSFYGWGKACQINAMADQLAPSSVMAGIGSLATRPRVYMADNNGAHGCVHYEFNGAHVRCFGFNENAQIYPPSAGNGVCSFRDDAITPPALPGNSTEHPNRIALGNRHTCAIDSGGILKCWGANFSGEIGTISGGATPTELGTGNTYAEVVTGYDHTCAVTADRTAVHCWGQNKYGQAGDGTQWRASPVLVAP